MAAARTLWFSGQVKCGTTGNLCHDRPWYRQKVAPSQLDVVWTCREALYDTGIVPIPRFIPDLAENALPLTASGTKLMSSANRRRRAHRMEPPRRASVFHR